jgi:hypothetical protein
MTLRSKKMPYVIHMTPCLQIGKFMSRLAKRTGIDQWGDLGIDGFDGSQLN